MKRLALAIFLGLAAVVPAMAYTLTFNWTWPTTRTDGSALALSSIGGATIYDTSVPVSGQPGTVVACPMTFPPTAAAGTCTTGTIAAGNHTYVIEVQDNSSPADVSASSNAVSVTVPLAPPSAVTNLTDALH